MWKEMPQFLRNLSKDSFKKKNEQTFINFLALEDSYTDFPSKIIQKVKIL